MVLSWGFGCVGCVGCVVWHGGAVVRCALCGADGLPVGVARYVLVYTLHPNLEPRAAIGEHLGDVGLQAVIGPCLNGQTDAFGLALLRIPDTHAHANS